jgi:hypothetical protein
MQAMSVAAWYAVSRGELERDPFKNIREAPDTRKEKGILTPVEVTQAGQEGCGQTPELACAPSPPYAPPCLPLIWLYEAPDQIKTFKFP